MLDGALGKLTFIFHLKPNIPIGVPFTVQYNPTTLNISHSIQYDEGTKLTVGNNQKTFLFVRPRTANLELLFDGTGASPSSLESISSMANSIGIPTPSNIKRVDLLVNLFLKLAYQVDGRDHQPLYCLMTWGTIAMACRFGDSSVNYTMFDNDGTPLRAKVTIAVEEFIDNNLLGKILSLTSPDLSHSVTVVEGDNLQQLCNKIYGDPSLYTEVAKVNKLNNYRKLKPGMELLFPPINPTLS